MNRAIYAQLIRRRSMPRESTLFDSSDLPCFCGYQFVIWSGKSSSSTLFSGTTRLATDWPASIVLLASNGVALAPSTKVHHNARRCKRWLNKYIFPGCYIPSLEQMTLAAGRQGLKILDMEIMRGHYAETLNQWRQAFRQNIATVCQDYDERFIRV